MIRGKQHKKSSANHNNTSTSSSSRGRGKIKGKTRGRGRGRGRGDGTRNQDNEDSECFRKRLLESNWDRYEEQEHEDDSSDDEDYDETKDFEYIKANTGGASSHFKFQEEKAWEEQLESQGPTSQAVDIFELDLQQLSMDLKLFDVVATCLPELEEEHQYCTKHLQETHFNNIQNSPSQAQTSITQAEINTTFPKWDFTGIEKYQHLFEQFQSENSVQQDLTTLTISQDELIKVSSSETHLQENQLNSSEGSLENSTDMSLDYDVEGENKEIELLSVNAENKRSPVLNPTSDECDMLDELLNAPSPSAEDISVKISSSKSSLLAAIQTNSVTDHDDLLDELLNDSTNKSETIKPDIESKEMDLDLLLESQNVKEPTNKTDDDNLDDWLDSMLE